MRNVLLLKGGGSTEHDISLISAQYIQSQIDSNLFNVFTVEIDKNFNWTLDGQLCELNFKKELITSNKKVDIDVVIPALHGYPGETGDIQSYLELIKMPYFGCNAETSVICFNKLLTKLTLENAGIKTVPFLQVNNLNDLKDAESFLNEHRTIYIKATNQGSSVGCYKVSSHADLKKLIKEAFNFSPFVILEKEIIGRELEVAAFEYKSETIITPPGEIICPNDFYTYEEKYSDKSETQTHVIAQNISPDIATEIKKQAIAAFDILKLRHLSRIDFFLSEQNEVFINEVNTFPGHTKISMFPMMMEHFGIKYSDYISSHLRALAQN